MVERIVRLSINESDFFYGILVHGIGFVGHF